MELSKVKAQLRIYFSRSLLILSASSLHGQSSIGLVSSTASSIFGDLLKGLVQTLHTHLTQLKKRWSKDWKHWHHGAGGSSSWDCVALSPVLCWQVSSTACSIFGGLLKGLVQTLHTHIAQFKKTWSKDRLKPDDHGAGGLGPVKVSLPWEAVGLPWHVSCTASSMFEGLLKSCVRVLEVHLAHLERKRSKDSKHMAGILIFLLFLRKSSSYVSSERNILCLILATIPAADS